jgi:hypothetical protein
MMPDLLRAWRLAGLLPLIALVLFGAHNPSERAGHDRADRRLFVVAVGVGAYHDEHRLNYPVRDAREVARAFAAAGAGVFSQVEVRLLTDAEADRAGVMGALAWLRDATTPRDVVVVYYAGHACDEMPGGYRIAPGRYRERAWRETTISGSELTQQLAAILGKTVVLLDTCYTGLIIDDGAPALRGPAYLGATRAGEQTRGGTAFSSDDFTRAVLDGLAGAADTHGDRVVTLGSLEQYAARRVSERRGKAQHVASAVPASWRSIILARLPSRP